MPVIAQPPRPAAGALLTRLHAIRTEHGYLPEEDLRRAARELAVPLSRLYSAATFYAAFGFEPRGRHTVQVCLGTACYIRGGMKLLERVQSILGVESGQTTEDRAFTLETVHCLGSCSMSPVIRVDNDTYGRLRADLLPYILKRYEAVGQGGMEEQTP